MRPEEELLKCIRTSVWPTKKNAPKNQKCLAFVHLLLRTPSGENDDSNELSIRKTSQKSCVKDTKIACIRTLRSTNTTNYSQVPVFLSLTQVLQEWLRSEQQKDGAFPEGAPAPQEVRLSYQTPRVSLCICSLSSVLFLLFVKWLIQGQCAASGTAAGLRAISIKLLLFWSDSSLNELLLFISIFFIIIV